MTDQLPSWRDTTTKAAIVDFVDRVTSGADADGTLLTEKPMPIAVISVKNDWSTVFADR